MITPEATATYAGWFRCLADPTRIRILNWLAQAGSEVPVGHVVSAMDVAQSTVSHHLKILQETGFVVARQAGTSTYVRVNQRCVDRFPSAAQIVMGTVPAPPLGEDGGCPGPQTSGPGSPASAADMDERRVGAHAGRAHTAGGAGARDRQAHAAVRVVQMRPGHWPAVASIYAAGIATGNATFEQSVPSWEDWDRSHLPGHRLVALSDGEPAGWAALAPVSGRCVYAGVAENSVYVAADSQGVGVGRALLDALILGAEQDGIWTIQTGIFPENEASLALHRACGFRVVGRREMLGRMGDRWRDVLLLERRSPHVR